jgi:GNAT superfamily N-acetyltransferase
MPVATWWRGDSLPALLPAPGLTVRRVTSWAEAQQVTDLSEDRVVARYQDRNALYAAFLGDQPAGYGWLALQVGRVDELRLTFVLSRTDIYLWDFVTLPAFRGRGVYPQLLQAIVRAEESAGRFWIGYEGHNHASARGIQKAGFQIVGDLIVRDGHLAGIAVSDPGERGHALVELLGLPVLHDE